MKLINSMNLSEAKVVYQALRAIGGAGDESERGKK
jgi:hypothetical protein